MAKIHYIRILRIVQKEMPHNRITYSSGLLHESFAVGR